jgi:hypothetical protein
MHAPSKQRSQQARQPPLPTPPSTPSTLTARPRSHLTGKRRKEVQRYEGGEKQRYFADDDDVDLATLVKRAKYGDTGMEMDDAMAANIARKANFKEAELDADAEYDYDAGLDMAEARCVWGGPP